MSKIGRLPITIPTGVTLTIDSSLITINGPKGQLSLTLPPEITVEHKDNQLIVKCLSRVKSIKSQFGATRAHLNNLIKGVSQSWNKDMEITGTGYKFALSGNKLTVTAGYIHPVIVTVPEGLRLQVSEETKLNINGCNKESVGQFASNIRKIRKPEPYKGKGIKYRGEFIKLKPGKAAKTTTG